jgi:hypothetical protein
MLTSLELDEKLLEWAALSSGSKSQKLGGNSQEQGGQSHNLYVTIPIDCARLYQLATRGSIRKFICHLLLAVLIGFLLVQRL